MDQAPFLAKAQEALKSAELLVQEGCFNSAANRAYYAVFHAARAALVAAGLASAEFRWSHDGIQGGLSQLTRRRKIYPDHLLRDLALLQSERRVADYRPDMVSSRVARDLVKRARTFVECIEREIAR